MFIAPESHEVRHSVRSAMFIAPESHEVRHSVRSAMSHWRKHFTPDGVSRLSGSDL
jgi:hypothetical protein